MIKGEKFQTNNLPLTIKPEMNYTTVIFAIIFVFVMISGFGFLLYLFSLDIRVDGEVIMIIIISILMFLAMGAVVLNNYMYKIKIQQDRLILKTPFFRKEIFYSDIDNIHEDTYSIRNSVHHRLLISTFKGQKTIDFYSETFNRNDIKNIIYFVKSKVTNKEETF